MPLSGVQEQAQHGRGGYSIRTAPGHQGGRKPSATKEAEQSELRQQRLESINKGEACFCIDVDGLREPSPRVFLPPFFSCTKYRFIEGFVKRRTSECVSAYVVLQVQVFAKYVLIYIGDMHCTAYIQF
jgi:hypothetical protein